MRRLSAMLGFFALLFIGSSTQLIAQPPSSSPSPTYSQLSEKNWTNAQLIQQIGDKQNWEGIATIAISPDSQIIAIGSHNYSRAAANFGSYLTLWNLKTGKKISTLFQGTVTEAWDQNNPTLRQEPNHQGTSIYGDYIHSVVFSPDGQTVAAAMSNKTIKLWNIKTGEEIRTLRGHTYAVHAIRITPDGQTLISGSSDRTIKFWNLKTGQLLRTLQGHSNGITSLAINKNGDRLASGSADKTIKLWNLQTGQLIRTFADIGRIQSLTFSPDGQTLASARLDYNATSRNDNSALKVWDLKTGRNILPLTNIKQAADVAISPDGKILASYTDTNNNPQIHLWNLKTGEEIRTYGGIPCPNPILAFSPDGQSLITSLGLSIQVWQ